MAGVVALLIAVLNQLDDRVVIKLFELCGMTKLPILKYCSTTIKCDVDVFIRLQGPLTHPMLVMN